ncbi:MAG: glycosyltransferase family 39 protein [Reyranella sp.]|uniref:glycosyltransferase family 39 protein n=1 Tax=Reyranella sp. TaxID=1929291 RepID=UPI001AC0436B|nr:glycosyltransferase family 39 protein [Reyranella sp.]MBN9085926.1 glycosyltransferase family 39 protein [Reyranella sp.]
MSERKRLEIASLGAVLVLATALRLWRLEANGFGTEYYAAGVRSALQGFSLLFYNSFDPAGFISLDKPPVAFWIQALFAKVLGFSGWTIHLPQALAGIASVALLYRLVRQPFGRAAAIIAALAMAVMPVAVAVDRSNNTDSWLVFFLLLAAWSALRGRGGSLVVAMALLGAAFNVKMLAALVCGPALLAGWWLSSPLDWRRRLGWMAGAGVTLAVVSLSWPVAFDLTPKDRRPYAGSTEGNSMLELVVVHNGLERFVRLRPEQPRPPEAAQAFQAYDDVPTGPSRLATPRLAAQFGWLLPLTLVGLFFVRRRDGIHPELALWGVWLIAYGVVFSAAGGIFHIYYLSALTPPVAALAGIGAVRLWRRGPAGLAIGLGLCAAWQVYLAGASLGWTTAWLGFPVVALAAGIAAVSRDKRPPAVIGGIALLALPAAWALSAIFSPGSLVLPSASLPRWLGMDDGRGPLLSRHYPSLSDDPKLEQFLLANRGNARFIVAAPTTGLVAPLIVRTGQPAMAVGGFFGNEPILTVEAFADTVKRGEVRYVLLTARARQTDLTRWVRTNGKLVDESEWRAVSAEGRRPIQLYDLR